MQQGNILVRRLVMGLVILTIAAAALLAFAYVSRTLANKPPPFPKFGSDTQSQ